MSRHSVRSPKSARQRLKSARRHLKQHWIALKAQRGLLAFGAFASIAAFTGLPAAAASLTVAPAPVALAAPQSLEVPSFVSPPIAERDVFEVTSFSVVQWPVPADTQVTSDFGYRSCAECSSNHLGVDFTPGAGTPVMTVSDGIVTEAAYAGVYGVHVVVEHVINGQLVSTLYAHLQNGSMAVSVGQEIARGTVVGAVGSTGQSTGPHLHFGVLIGGDYVDPYPWLLANVNS